VGYDVVIVGGGVVGSAVAHHLGASGAGIDIAVVERDPTYTYASTVRSAGNVRVQFSLRENVLMSMHAVDLLDEMSAAAAGDTGAPDPAPRRQGNLFLADAGMADRVRQALAMQRELGCDVEWLDPETILARYPGLTNRGIVGGTFGARDGSIDPAALLAYERRSATAAGASWVSGEVVGLRKAASSVVGVDLADGARIDADTVVVCAGAWTPQLLGTIGVDIPVDPVMRTMFLVAGPVPTDGVPSVILPGGVYLLPEQSGRWVVGWSTSADPVGFDFTPHPHRHFEDVIWPRLVDVLPGFDALRIERSWAGLYAVNRLDGNAILGRWPGIDGLLLATGFSGHGLQHAPAMGRYLAELVLASPHALDLGRLGARRILEGRPLREDDARLI
jgi:FAD-dependent oxidoreductase domain-containing protein 1